MERVISLMQKDRLKGWEKEEQRSMWTKNEWTFPDFTSAEGKSRWAILITYGRCFLRTKKYFRSVL